MNNPSELIEMPALNNFWWAQNINGLKFGDGASASSFSIASDFCMTDTGTSLVYIPESMYNNVIDRVLEDVSADVYQINDDEVLSLCEPTLFPKISVRYGGYWAEILPEDYILDVSIAQDESICMVGLTWQADEEGWMLGDVFLRGFYATHDMDNKKFGFAPSAGSSKNPLIAGGDGGEELEGGGRGAIFYIIVFIIAFGIAAVIYFVLLSGQAFVPNHPLIR